MYSKGRQKNLAKKFWELNGPLILNNPMQIMPCNQCWDQGTHPVCFDPEEEGKKGKAG